MIMRSSKVDVASLVSVVALLAGCGSSDGGGGSCGKVSPCGGSLVGTWTITSSCESVSNFTFGAECPGATLDESQVTSSGTMTFNADMTVTSSLSVSGTRRFSLPLACGEAAAVGSCDEYASLIVPAPPEATTTCPTVGSACNCTMVYAVPTTSSGAGTYSAAGNLVTLISPAGDPVDFGYCVQGNTLHLIQTDPATGAFMGAFVATK